MEANDACGSNVCAERREGDSKLPAVENCDGLSRLIAKKESPSSIQLGSSSPVAICKGSGAILFLDLRLLLLRLVLLPGEVARELGADTLAPAAMAPTGVGAILLVFKLALAFNNDARLPRRCVADAIDERNARKKYKNE